MEFQRHAGPADRPRLTGSTLGIAAVAVFSPASGHCHDVPAAAQARMADGNWLDFLWTGAEHMLTGYDHLLFLLGVVFFLSSLRDIVTFVTAFTVAHTLVLLTATPLRIGADHHLVDAFIAMSVAYKGFENLQGFPRCFGFAAPPLLAMVFVFGLVHGMGLSTQLQSLTLAEEPRLLAKILWFNVGVELGQIAALCVMVPVINAWRRTIVWDSLSRVINTGLVVLGFMLMLFQLHGYLHAQQETTGINPMDAGWHSHGDGPPHRHD